MPRSDYSKGDPFPSSASTVQVSTPSPDGSVPPPRHAGPGPPGSRPVWPGWAMPAWLVGMNSAPIAHKTGPLAPNLTPRGPSLGEGAPSMRRTSGSGRRGAVIIETALVAPLLLVIVFGIVEMAFLKKDDAALASLVRAGGRTAASALADHREQSHQPSEFCSAPACSVDNAPELADAAATAIVRSDARLSKDAIHELWVYKANAKGYPGTADSTGFGSCVNACVVYRWSPERHTFEYVSGSWRADDIHACVDG